MMYNECSCIILPGGSISYDIEVVYNIRKEKSQEACKKWLIYKKLIDIIKENKEFLCERGVLLL